MVLVATLVVVGQLLYDRGVGLRRDGGVGCDDGLLLHVLRLGLVRPARTERSSCRGRAEREHSGARQAASLVDDHRRCRQCGSAERTARSVDRDVALASGTRRELHDR
jgi:hypothetical protein